VPLEYARLTAPHAESGQSIDAEVMFVRVQGVSPSEVESGMAKTSEERSAAHGHKAGSL